MLYVYFVCLFLYVPITLLPWIFFSCFILYFKDGHEENAGICIHFQSIIFIIIYYIYNNFFYVPESEVPPRTSGQDLNTGGLRNLPQIYTVIAYICIGKVAWFSVYICSNLWNALYHHAPNAFNQKCVYLKSNINILNKY